MYVCCACYMFMDVYFSISLVFEYLRMRISSNPRSIAGVPFDLVKRFRASLLLRITCMRFWSN